MLSPSLLGAGIIEMTLKITISLHPLDRQTDSLSSHGFSWLVDWLVGFMSRRIGLSATLVTGGFSVCLRPFL
jgi:hypothetical protein